MLLDRRNDADMNNIFLYVQVDDFSKMTSEDAAKLGPLLCELQPSQLRLMAPEVLKSSLMAAASCGYIPPEHSMELIKLVVQTFG